MRYLALIAFGWIASFLYANRAWFAVKFYHAKVRSGDYDCAFRRLRWVRFAIPKINALGLEASSLLLAGRAAEAEPLIRDALDILKPGSSMPRERLCSLLGHTYTDLERYDAAEKWLEEAIRAGDVTGNSQNGLAELRLQQGRAQEALAINNLAIEVAGRRANRKVPVVTMRTWPGHRRSWGEMMTPGIPVSRRWLSRGTWRPGVRAWDGESGWRFSRCNRLKRLTSTSESGPPRIHRARTASCVWRNCARRGKTEMAEPRKPDAADAGSGGRHPGLGRQCYRRALAGTTDAALRRHVLCSLGYTLTDLGRYDEAQRCLEHVIEMGDNNGGARLGISDLLLQQGKEPEKALGPTEEAIRMRADGAALAEPLGNKAWALALMGRTQEMEESAATALGGVNPGEHEVVASVHWRIGKALIAASRVPQAIEHFRAACKADPDGHHGQVTCAATLRERSRPLLQNT